MAICKRLPIAVFIFFNIFTVMNECLVCINSDMQGKDEKYSKKCGDRPLHGGGSAAVMALDAQPVDRATRSCPLFRKYPHSRPADCGC